jgi:hypothetical protein
MIYLELEGFGQVVTREISDLSQISITYRRKTSDGADATGFSGDLVLYGATAQFVRDKLIDAPDALNNTIAVNVFDDCCPDANGNAVLVFKGEINAGTIDWCEGDCSISANLAENSDDSKKLACIQTVYIWSKSDGEYVSFTDPAFAAAPKPFVRHCLELRPALIHHLFFNILSLWFLIAFALTPLLLVIGYIVTAINVFISIFGGDPIGGDINFFDDVFNWVYVKLPRAINGCGDGHPAPLVHQYLDHACGKCGLTLSSSIFGPGGAYRNVAFFYAPVDGGREKYQSWIEDNKPLYTLEVFLKLLSQTFNADYRVVGNVLTFERRDFFGPASPALDLSAGYAHPDVLEICYKYSKDTPPAYGDFRYSKDAMDWVGNEAINYYDSVVEWKDPASQYPQFNGKKDVQIPFAPARFRDDGIEDDVLTYWNNGDLGELYVGSEYNNLLIMPQHVCTQPKLLFLEDNFDWNNARVIRIQKPDGINFWYNFPLWMNGTADEYAKRLTMRQLRAQAGYDKIILDGGSVQDAQDVYDEIINVEVTPYLAPNLYERFWYIEDSRLQITRNVEFTVRLTRSCASLALLNFESGVLLPIGLGRINQYSIKGGIIEISGTA